ncbi:STAS domain-containing protein [Neptuniibacter sp.]|uniref:STAS domain-containing protein n=1 Tax=Neptuniibacter sp. TaxID=1962643 RepID=UPI002631D37C|nr:STAS domain-containing protein [Neptuniibacter sp.]MCP4596121.1 STAS domain-containing protein [Neptuniibacter sp.]
MIRSHLDSSKKSLTIDVADRFDYSIHKEFRAAYDSHNEPNTKYTVDLSKTLHIDSSALGMLLILKEKAEKSGGEVTLKNPSDSASKILKVAKFDKLFKVS